MKDFICILLFLISLAVNAQITPRTPKESATVTFTVGKSKPEEKLYTLSEVLTFINLKFQKQKTDPKNLEELLKAKTLGFVLTANVSNLLKTIHFGKSATEEDYKRFQFSPGTKVYLEDIKLIDESGKKYDIKILTTIR